MSQFNFWWRLWLAAWMIPASGAFAGTLTYTHDSAGRLTLVDYGGGKAIAYTYDASGNLLGRAVTSGAADADGDGMEDSWEQSFFGSLSRDGAGDLDGDGFKDLNEYLAGTNPTLASSLLRITTAATTAGTSTTVEWQAVAGKTYRVQFKNSLADLNWQDLPGDVPATGAVASKVDSGIGNQPARFYRVILAP